MTQTAYPLGGPDLDVLGTPYPGDVGRDEEKRRRWNLAASASCAASAALEPSGQPNMGWVFMATRAVYDSPLPTG